MASHHHDPPSKEHPVHYDHTKTSAFYRKKLRSFFKKLDTNKDDYVTYQEYVVDVSDRVRRLIKGRPEKVEETVKLIQDYWDGYWAPIGIEKDGQTMVHISKFEEISLVSEEGRQIEADTMRTVFHATDLDEDGFISVEELKIFFQCWGTDPNEAQHSFDVMDTNKDGKISLDEFVSAGVSYFCDQHETDGQYFWGPLVE